MSDGLSRRRFLLGGAALGVLAGCGEEATAEAVAPQIVSLFSPDRVIAAGQPQRIPFAVVDVGGLDLGDTAEVPVRVLFDGETIDHLTVAGRVVEHDHVNDGANPGHEHADLLRYYPLRTTLPEPGIYDLEIDFGAHGTGRLPVQAFAPDEVGVLRVGQPMPSILSPTMDAPQGASPLCTLFPSPCPFHDVTIAESRQADRPMAVLVATPALCVTAYCGPVLETLIAEAPAFPEVTMIHLEVYANADEVDGNYNDERLRVAPSVTDLGLEFEPSLFLVDRSGIVVDRIDNLYDRTELIAALETIAAP